MIGFLHNIMNTVKRHYNWISDFFEDLDMPLPVFLKYIIGFILIILLIGCIDAVTTELVVNVVCFVSVEEEGVSRSFSLISKDGRVLIITGADVVYAGDGITILKVTIPWQLKGMVGKGAVANLISSGFDDFVEYHLVLESNSRGSYLSKEIYLFAGYLTYTFYGSPYDTLSLKFI